MRGDLGGSGSQNSPIDLQMMYSNNLKADTISPAKGGAAENEFHKIDPINRASSGNSEVLDRMSHVMKELTQKAQFQINDLAEHNKFLHDYLNQRKSTPIVSHTTLSPSRGPALESPTKSPGYLEVRRSTSFHPISVTTSPAREMSPSKVIIRSGSKTSIDGVMSPGTLIHQTPVRGTEKADFDPQTSPQTFRFEERKMAIGANPSIGINASTQRGSGGQDSYYLALKSTAQNKTSSVNSQKEASIQASPLRSILKNRESAKTQLNYSAKSDQHSFHLRQLRENADAYIQPSDFSFEDGSKVVQVSERPSLSDYPLGYQYEWAPDSQDSRTTARFNLQTPQLNNDGRWIKYQLPEVEADPEAQLKARADMLREKLSSKLAKSQQILNSRLMSSKSGSPNSSRYEESSEMPNWQKQVHLTEISQLQRECDELEGRLSVTLRNLHNLRDEKAKQREQEHELKLQVEMKGLLERSSLSESQSMSVSKASTPLLRESYPKVWNRQPRDSDEYTERIMMGSSGPGRSHQRGQLSVDWTHAAGLNSTEDERTFDTRWNKTKHHRSVSESAAVFSALEPYYNSEMDDQERRRQYIFGDGASVRDEVLDDEDLLRLEAEKLAIESRVRAQKRQRPMIVERLRGCQLLAESISLETGPHETHQSYNPSSQHYFSRDTRGDVFPHKY